jgi:hypothetical protein
MDAENSTGIATAEDFFEASRQASPIKVTLPSGLSVLLARPSFAGSYDIARRNVEMLKAMIEARPDNTQAAAENYMDWLTSLFTWAFVSPRFSADPKPGEIGLPHLPVDDLRYIARWLGPMGDPVQGKVN